MALKRVASRLAGAAAVLLCIGALFLWMVFRASLPVIDGSAQLPGLTQPVTLERDAAGVPTITAQDRTDLARVLGYAHGQDRFFQMDLLRRAAAGELSALLGPSLLPLDRRLRVHRFRSVAHEVVMRLAERERTLLTAYVEGVNAGLESLRSRPFEYWVLRSPPRPWTAEDTILCIHAMFLQLQDAEGHTQLQRGLLHAGLPESVAHFLDAGAPEWDATLDGSEQEEPRVPTDVEFDLRGRIDLPVMPPAAFLSHLSILGSNNWAVAGSRTAGSAVIANDMHLGYRVPNIWYRARLVKTGGADALDLTGVTLPGTPTTVAGSNRSIAWGFTNSYGQFANVVRLVPVDGNPDAYQTAKGPVQLRFVDELIEVAGKPTEHLRVALSDWGPVVGRDWDGRPYVLQWTAQDPQATNLDLLKLEPLESVDAALRAAARFGIPGQNFMVADRGGHIGWTIAGRLPVRGTGGDGLPQRSTDAFVGFTGWLDPALQPTLSDPVDGYLWTANARVVGGAAGRLIGEDAMDRGSRAAQIRSDLHDAATPFTPESSLRIQLDDRALFLERWRALLAALLEQTFANGDRSHEAVRATLSTWTGHAVPADAAYRLVNRFREEVEARAFFMLISPLRQNFPDFEFAIPSSFEGPLWRLIQERPAHLLAAPYGGWDDFLLQALNASERLPAVCTQLQSCTWGVVNAVHIEHPLSGALPLLAPLLDMPTVSVPGGREDMPRIQGRDYGASERFSVAPGLESQGLFHMPGAQSGHPLSPFYRTGFDDWREARPSPFLPGPSAHSLALAP